MTRLINALNKRRSLLKDSDKGFTLIELLVVVIIIGILAAIAIPIYLGIQNNAKDSAVKSDLTNVKTAVVAHFTANSGVYTAIGTTAATLGNDGYSGNSVAYSPAANAPNWKGGTIPTSNTTTFCIQATSPTGNPFSVSDSGGVVAGLCP